MRPNKIDYLERDFLIVFILFFFLWAAILFNSIFIFLTFRYFKKFENGYLMNKYDKQLKRMIRFPLAMVILWIVPSIYRFFQMGDKEILSLSIIHAICEGINGAVNTLIYAMSKKFKEELKSSFLKNGDQFLTSL